MDKEGGDVEIAYKADISRARIWAPFTGFVFQNVYRCLLANLSWKFIGVKL
jgi:hypothetical protein